MRAMILAATALLAAGPALGQDYGDEVSPRADAAYIMQHKGETVDALNRLKQALVNAQKDHASGCLELGRLFDQSSDLKPVQVALRYYYNAPGQTVPQAHYRYIEAERNGDNAMACVSGYASALVFRATGRDADAESALGYARRGLGHMAQLAATPAAANAPASAALNTAARSPGVRVALLIANGRYSAKADMPPLKTPAADVALIAASLRRAGFTDVAVVQNAGRAEMVEALRRFQDRADHADTALIYYAGHGLQSQGENYAIPTDARLADERSVPDEAVSQARLMEAMARTGKLKILVMDACRDNPFGSSMQTGGQSGGATRGVTRGLARIVPPKSHTVVVYSAASGQQAQDGQGTNSPFASALSRRMLEPGVEIDLVLRRVDDDVLKATGGAQEPNVAGNLGADPFFFIPPNA